MTTAAITFPRAIPAKRARYSPGKARQQSPASLLGFCLTSDETAPQWGLWRGGVFTPLRPEDYGMRLVWDAKTRVVGLEPI